MACGSCSGQEHQPACPLNKTPGTDRAADLESILVHVSKAIPPHYERYVARDSSAYGDLPDHVRDMAGDLTACASALREIETILAPCGGVAVGARHAASTALKRFMHGDVGRDHQRLPEPKAGA